MSGTTAIAWPVRRNYESFTEPVLLGDKPQGISYLPISTPRIVGMALVERKGKTELGWITWTPETCEITIRTEYFQK